METQTASQGSRMLFQLGWWILVILLALFAVNHIAGVWTIAESTDEAQMFELFGILHVLGLIVLLIPYRRRQRWAWWTTWVAIAPVGLTFAFFQDAISTTYLVTAGVMALAQFATLPGFRKG